MAPLICLPPTGAGPGIYRAWTGDPDILAPAIPGREARFAEPPPRSLSEMADEIATTLAPPPRYALFGYSMGGTVALLLAHRLIARGHPGPEALFVLGALPPAELARSTRGLATLETEAFWAEIGRIGGTPPEILGDAEMRALVEPMIRHDFALCAACHHTKILPLSCPVHAFVAAEDHLVPAESVAGWRGYTTGRVYPHRLPGGHMLGPDAFAALRDRVRALR